MIFLEKEIVGYGVCNLQKLVCSGQKSVQFFENKWAQSQKGVDRFVKIRQ